MTIERWLGLMARLGLPPSQEEFSRLAATYTGPDRHYHNAAHIAHCLAELDAALPHIPNPAPLELALWFHDAVYDPRSPSNEADSAAWASDFLRAAHAPRNLGEQIVRLILATRHRPGPLAGDAAWMVDIDLAILGQKPTRFAAYKEAIRLEYAWVPQATFRAKRQEILRGFLERPSLYATPFFHHKYEAQARRNLAWAIAKLSEGETS